MKKRWIPLLLLCTVAAFIFGLRLGSLSEAEQHQPVHEAVNATIAVINSDAGAEINGVHLNYATAIINTLDDRFMLVSPAMAQSGLDSGMFSAVVTFPHHVSTRVLSFNAYMPQRVEVEFIISPQLSDREFLETHLAIMGLQLAINTTLANTYVSSIFRQFHEAQDQVGNIFQNSLADLMALEMLTFSNFTDGLDLSHVPVIDLNPRELDTEFYFGQVYNFASDIAGWYLRSYEMASDQFLWMREGLFDLTAGLPDEEQHWIDMLEHWTWYSEEYGRLLEIYAAYVAYHDQSLYEWFNENVDWNETLGNFQDHLTEWHADSQAWFSTSEEWHSEFLGYLTSVVDFQTALEDFQTVLDGSSTDVQGALREWQEHLQQVMDALERQYNVLRETEADYNEKAIFANEFLELLDDMYDGLHDWHEEFADWLVTIRERREDINTFHYDLNENHEALHHVADFILYWVTENNHMPDAPIARLYLQELFDEIEIPEVPYLEHLYPWVWTWQIGDLPEIDELYYFEMPDSPFLQFVMPEMPTIPGQPNINFPSNMDMNFLPPHMLMDTLMGIHGQLIAWHGSLGATANDLTQWRTDANLYWSILESDLQDWYDELTDTHLELEDFHDQVETQRLELNARLEDIEYRRINAEAFYYRLNYLHATMEEPIEAFEIWNETLQIMHDELLEQNDAQLTNFEELLAWHTALNLFSAGLAYELYNLPPPLDPAEWLLIPDLPAEDEYRFVNLTMEPLPEDLYFNVWEPEIAPPEDYIGIEIQEAFNHEFALRGHQMREPFDMDAPPVYMGMMHPDFVREHGMMTARQPESPLLPPPPRPDGFWRNVDFMQDQLLRFEVSDFLNEHIHRQVDSSLASYDRFLEGLRDSLVHTFGDNVWRMHEVHREYEWFLQDLRFDALENHREEHENLQEVIETFAASRHETLADTQNRLGTFASMMPETRQLGGINQQVVDFTVSPFEFLSFNLGEHEAVLLEAIPPLAYRYDGYLHIVLIIMAAVFAVTVVGSAVAHVVRKRKER